jgi:hypothetical protein
MQMGEDTLARKSFRGSRCAATSFWLSAIGAQETFETDSYRNTKKKVISLEHIIRTHPVASCVEAYRQLYRKRGFISTAPESTLRSTNISKATLCRHSLASFQSFRTTFRSCSMYIDQVNWPLGITILPSAASTLP